MFEDFAVGRLSIGDFQTQMYSRPALADVLGGALHGELLNADYSPAGAPEIYRRVEEFLEQQFPGRLSILRVQALCDQLLSGTVDVKTGCRELLRLRANEPWIPAIVVGYDSELDNVPSPSLRSLWDEDAYERAWAHAEPLREGILEAVRQIRETAAFRLIGRR